MRTLLLAAILLVCLAQGTIAFNMCPEGICTTMSCHCPPILRNNPHYRIIPHTGPCGCCETCQEVLGENESCPVNQGDALHPADKACADGFKCDQVKHVCVKASK